MQIPTTPIKWVIIPNWHTTNFVGWGGANGLFRAIFHGKTMFIGHAAEGGLGPRLLALRRPGQKYHAGVLIYRHRAEITMRVAVLDWPPDDIVHCLGRLVDKHQPSWNVPNGHHRDF